MTTLLEDATAYLKTLDDDETPYDDEMAEATQSEIAETNIHLGQRRWGSNEAFVLSRNNEHVMVTYYSYSGDSDGPSDAEVCSVYPHEVTTIEWRKS